MADEWRADIERLHQALRKSGLISLLLLYFTLSGLSSAMERVDGPEAEKYFSQLTSADKEALKSHVSYVFGAQLEHLQSGTQPSDSSAIEEVARQLETLAREWFQARFSLLGATISVDLRIIAPAVPFAVVVVAAYCWLLSRKAAFLRKWLSPPTTDHNSEPHGLINSSTFHNHPNALATSAALLVAAILVGYLIAEMDVFLELFSERDRTTYLCAVASAVGWAVLYCAHVTTAMRGRRIPERGWLYLLHRGLRELRRLMLVRARRRMPRLQVSSGALLVLATLWMFTADACGSPRRGYQYFLGSDAVWFNGGAFGAFTDIVMRPSYDALVIGAAISLLMLLVSSVWRAGQCLSFARRSAWLASAISRASLLMVVCSISFYTGPDNVGDAIAVLVWLCATIWLWFARNRPIVRTRREIMLAVMLLPAALSFGFFAIQQLRAERLLGVPCFAIGVLLQLRVYQWFGWRKYAAAERGDFHRVLNGIKRGLRRFAPAPY